MEDNFDICLLISINRDNFDTISKLIYETLPSSSLMQSGFIMSVWSNALRFIQKIITNPTLWSLLDGFLLMK